MSTTSVATEPTDALRVLVESIADGTTDEAVVATSMHAFVTSLIAEPAKAQTYLGALMAHADSAGTPSDTQVLERAVATRLGTLVAYRSARAPSALVSVVRELRQMLAPDQRTARLRDSIAVLDDVRSGFTDEEARLKWQENMIWPFSVAIRHSLARASAAAEPEAKADWYRWAWGLSYACKCRILRERLGAEIGAPPDPERVLADMKALYRTHPRRRPLLMEFFAANDAELAVFLVPLWSAGTLRCRVIRSQPGAVRGMLGLLSASVARICDAKQTSSIEGHPDEARLMDAICQFSDLLAEVEPDLVELAPTDLVISPHQHLGAIPWSAVCSAARRPGWQVQVCTLPSPSLASELRIVAARAGAHRMRACVLGYGPPLADAEAELVHRALRVGGWAVAPPMVGPSARADELIRCAQGCSILHVAAHCVLHREPFSRSGIELADRRLLIGEISRRLRLAPGSLVFLSGCNTAHTLYTESDELRALAREFIVAGAGSVLATLWPTDDSAAVVFSSAFYTNLARQPRNVRSAFASAMNAARNRWPQSPYRWAPFTLLLGTDALVPTNGGGHSCRQHPTPSRPG